MSVVISEINANTDTFAGWISITNQIAQTISNAVITANTTGSNTGNSTVSYTARLFGTFIANTITINNTLTGPAGANATISTNVVVDGSYNLYTIGHLSALGNVTIDTTTKLRFADRSSTYSSTTGWLKANSTGYMAFANLNVKGTDLDPAEFLLTSNVGYANTTNSAYDTIVYDTSSNKWVRTRLTHLTEQQIDTLTLGTVNANSSGQVRFNANVNFGGTTASLFISNTAARIGVGGVTNPEAPLHVNGAIYATGDVTAYYTSDERLKKNIKLIDNSLEKILKLNGVEFDWDKEAIADLTNVGPKPDNDIGLVAQDVEKVAPQAVYLRSDGYKAVDYSKLVPLLIEAIKHLNDKVQTLELGLKDK